jgi:hypothetical protein
MNIFWVAIGIVNGVSAGMQIAMGNLALAAFDLLLAALSATVVVNRMRVR